MAATSLTENKSKFGALLWAFLEAVGLDADQINFDPEVMILVFPSLGLRNEAVDYFERDGKGLRLEPTTYAGIEGTAAVLGGPWEK